jgi:hypothetical protein
MSMIGNYLRVSNEALSHLLDHPDQLFETIYPDE